MCAVQDEIAVAIAKALKVTLRGEASRGAPAKPARLRGIPERTPSLLQVHAGGLHTRRSGVPAYSGARSAMGSSPFGAE